MDPGLLFSVVSVCAFTLIFMSLKALTALTRYTHGISGGPDGILRKRVFEDKETVRTELVTYFDTVKHHLYKATFCQGMAVILIALMLKMMMPGISLFAIAVMLFVMLLGPIAVFCCIFYIMLTLEKDAMRKINEG